MKSALYSNPSTFTYLGRHASELKFLLNRAKRKNEILDIGSGPFEPFYIAALSPESKITVVESNPKIVEKIQSIRDGVLMPIKDTASLCCNINDDGVARQNKDLTDERMIRKGMAELKLAGISPSTFMFNETEFFGYNGKNEFVILDPMDISKIQPWKKFDIVFDGMVLLNLRKILSDQEFEATVSNVLELTRESGVLGIATTPAGMSGSKEYLSIITKIVRNRMPLQELILDNVVGTEQGLHGGYLATFANDWQSSVKFKDIDSFFSSDPLMLQATLFRSYLDETRLLDFLHANGFLLLYAIHEINNFYNACFLKLDEIELPKERYQFSVMANLASKNH